MLINNDFKSCKKLKHLGLFEGIGGFSLAARWAGWETVAWCEWNEFGQKVLRHHFPEAEGFGDITKTDFRKYANKIDILTGGFPCQPYSLAGKRKGKEDDRHLWPEMLRAIREIRPRWVVGENVFGLINWNGGLVFEEVQADLEAEGYEVWAYVLPACAVNAPHRRDRLWFVAYAQSARINRINRNNTSKTGKDWCRNDKFNGCSTLPTTNSDCNGQHGSDGQHEINTSEGGINALNDFDQATMHTNGTSKQGEHLQQKRKRQFDGSNSRTRISTWPNFPTQSPICSRNDGLPSQLDGITFSKWRSESIKAYGNAIVPQVAFEIFKAINQMP
jgi:DNA (cytosine-5)-methyltransferase 1